MPKSPSGKYYPLVTTLLLALIICSLGLIATGASMIRSGETTLLDWDQSRQGFSFEYGGAASTKLDFFISDRGTSSIIHVFESPGIIDMGKAPLGKITEAPKVGYGETATPLQGHSYVIRSKGQYAKIYIRKIFSTGDYKQKYVTEYKLDWVLQPNGTRQFSTDSNIGNNESNSDKTEMENIERSLPLTEDFNYGSLDGWKTVHGNWNIKDGKLVQSSNYYEGNLKGGTYALTGPSNWRNYSVSARIMSKDDDKIGFVFRYLDPDNYYILSWQKQGSKMRFTKILDGKEEGLATTEIGYRQSKWYNLKVEVSGNMMMAYLDGKRVLATSDSSLTRGKVGLYCHGNTGSYFDDFTVRGVQGAIGQPWSDKDGDGIEDRVDICSETPTGIEVDERGCRARTIVKASQNQFRLESGTITVDNEWKKIHLDQSFTYPIVVAGPISYAGYDPATIAIRNVTPTGFEIRIQEWGYLDGTHAIEKVSYLAVERGNFTLSNGLEIEADVISTHATGATNPDTPNRSRKINFFSEFRETPIVLASKVTLHGTEAVTTRISSVTSENFHLIMQEQGSSDQGHEYESISYIALSPGSGNLGGNNFFIGKAEAAGDFSTIQFPSGQKLEVIVDEEGSIDEEDDHLPESIGYLILGDISTAFLADMQTMNGFDTANLRYQKVTGGNPILSSHYVCKTDILEGKCGPFKGSHTYEFSPVYAGNIKAMIDTGRGFGCSSTVTFSVLAGGSWEVVTKVQAKSSQNEDEFALAEYILPVNKTIEGFKISDGCACCIDNSEIWINTYQQGTNQTTIKTNTRNTVTLRHWGGEGSYEEGYDFTEKRTQRYGETGPDNPSLNPDFFYTGSWERSFPTTQPHNSLNPLERIDYGAVNFNQINGLPAWNDPRFKKGHLEAGHTYGFYTKEGNYVLLKVNEEKEIPREDWHIGDLNFSWKLLTGQTSNNSDGCPIFIGGKWVEASGNCRGTIWDIVTEGETPELTARARCNNGYRGTWSTRNVSFSGCTLEFDVSQNCTVCNNLDENRTGGLAINYQNDESARLILTDGTVIYLGRPR